jgi:hypothetical protein
MAIDEQEKSRRRRIVYHSVSPFSNGDVVAAALRLLDEEFADSPLFSGNQFLMKLTQSGADIGPSKTRIFGKMMELSKLVAEAIGPDPVMGGGAAPAASTPRPQATPTATPAAPAATSPVKSLASASGLSGMEGVFNTLLNHLALQVERHGDEVIGRMTTYLKTQGRELGLGAMTQLQFRTWCDAPTSKVLVDCSKDEMSSIVHGCYVWLCEEFGPVIADRMMKQSVVTAEAHADAATHPPRELL